MVASPQGRANQRIFVKVQYALLGIRGIGPVHYCTMVDAVQDPEKGRENMEKATLFKL